MSLSKHASDSTPWYRHRWPWILMAGPAIVIVAGFITAWLAIVSNDGVVEDNYYKVGLAVNQQLKEKQLAAELNLKADMSFLADKREIRVLLSGIPEEAFPQTLQLKLIHPTRKGEDQILTLQRHANAFVGVLAASVGTGRWNVVLEDPFAGWRMDGVWNMQTSSRITVLAKTH
ncbi:MAG: FixH family protein [Fluviibacter sp.]